MTDVDWIGAALTSARPQAVAALLRYFRDLDTAEEAFQEACLRALKTWPKNGPPRDPAAWLIFVGRNVALDTVRRRARQQPLPDESQISDLEDAEAGLAENLDQADYSDDVLRLLFVCCHPGASLIVMRSPEGQDMPCPGVYLEVVPNERLVFTDAYTSAWVPSQKPFMTVTVTFENVRGKTRYTARVRHWSVADREAHEKMGFYEGWGRCTDQLAELAAKL